jgi:hypothetical protein
MKDKRIALLLVSTVTLAGACGPVRDLPEQTTPEPIGAEALACEDPVPKGNRQITSAMGESSSPVVAWSNEAFAISWWDMRGRYPAVHVTRVDREGTKRSLERMLPHEGISRGQTIAADSEEAHLVWVDEGAVMSERIGLMERPAVKLAVKADAAAAGPWGAVAWVTRGSLLFRCDGMLPPPGRDGAREEPAPILVHQGGIESPDIAWSGKHYAVVWSSSVKGGRRIMMQRISNRGTLLGGAVPISVTSGVSRKPVVVWTGREFAVAWTNAAPADQNPKDRYRIFFSLLPALDGGPRLTRQLGFNGSADEVALGATGVEFAVAWVGSKEPMGTAVYFGRLAADGEPVGETVRVSDDEALTCGRPSIAWGGDGWGVVWHDDRNAAGSQVLFSFVECGADVEAVEDGGLPSEDAGLSDAPGLKKLFDQV